MDQHAVELRGMGEAVPIHLLHLPRFIGMEEEVAARGAPGQCQGRAWVDDAGSGDTRRWKRMPCRRGAS